MADQAPAQPFTDFGPLLDLIKSGDPRGIAAAKNLTSDEQQKFFDYQQQANKGKGEATRTDNQILGVPPELAVASAIPIVRAIAAPAASAGARVVAGATAAAPQIAAQAKYWGTKAVLTKLGVPPLLAEGAAVAMSGYKRGASGGAAEAVPTVSSPESAPATVAPSASEVPAPAASTAPKTTAPAVTKMTLQSVELPELQRLLASGKTMKESLDLIQQQRDFVQRLGLPTATAAKAAVNSRNTSGSWQP